MRIVFVSINRKRHLCEKCHLCEPRRVFCSLFHHETLQLGRIKSQGSDFGMYRPLYVCWEYSSVTSPTKFRPTRWWNVRKLQIINILEDEISFSYGQQFGGCHFRNNIWGGTLIFIVFYQYLHTPEAMNNNNRLFTKTINCDDRVLNFIRRHP